MKREKLFYGAAFALLAAALVAALWYKRPLNIRQVTGITEPEEISVTILRRNADMDLEQRDLTLSAGDEGFDALLARLEEIEFRRPPTNLIRMALPFLPESAETAPAGTASPEGGSGEASGATSAGGGTETGGGMPSFDSFPGTGASASGGGSGGALAQYGLSFAVFAAALAFALLYRRRPRRR